MIEAIRQVSIRGRVQGVGYRAWVAHTAARLGLYGWVRNRRDGSVEALLAGPERVVAEMIALCRRGPGSARVEAVTVQEAHPDTLKAKLPDEAFSILPTL